MRLAEQKLWDCFREHADRRLVLQRVENLVGDGMPDIYVLGTGAWVEMKSAAVPKRSTTPLMGESGGLRQSQKNWITVAVRKGRPVYVLIRDDSGTLYFIDGSYADEMNLMSALALSVISLASTWDGINAILIQGLAK